MQLHTFPDGSYVAHRVYVDGSWHSIWFGPDGRLTDAEMFDRLRRPRAIAPGSPRWRLLERRAASIARPVMPEARREDGTDYAGADDQIERDSVEFG